ncbi:unnamed protein product, partial [Effrenium voratum]
MRDEASKAEEKHTNYRIKRTANEENQNSGASRPKAVFPVSQRPPLSGHGKRSRGRACDACEGMLMATGGVWQQVLQEFFERRSASTIACNRAIQSLEPPHWRASSWLLAAARAPDVLSYGLALGGFGTRQWRLGTSWLAQAPLRRLAPNAVVWTTAASSCQWWRMALQLLGMGGLRADTVSFSSSVARVQEWQAALALLMEMAQRALRRNVVALGAAQAACDWTWGLRMLAEQAPRLSERLCDAGVLSCVEGGQWSKALALFLDTEQQQTSPRSATSFLHMLATLRIEDPEVIHGICVEAVAAPLTEVPKLLWATTMLGAWNAAFYRRCSAEVLRRRRALSGAALLRCAWALASAEAWGGGGVWRRLQEEVMLRLREPLAWQTQQDSAVPYEDFLGILWSCNMAGVLMAPCRQMLAQRLRERGRARDAANGRPSLGRAQGDRAVLLKPPGWGTCDGESPLQAAQVAQEMFGDVPIFADRQHWHGFLHRLDVPCSGLLLLATSYEAFYDLQLQLHVGDLARDYVLLCHGCLATRRLGAPLLARGGVTLAGRGRRSVSCAKALGHGTDALGRFLSLAAVKIWTGRQHQIRCHLAHVGHPTVHAPRSSGQARGPKVRRCLEEWVWFGGVSVGLVWWRV